MPRSAIVVSVVTAVCAAVFAGCAPLSVSTMRPASLRGVADVSFLGATDARVLFGGVQETKAVTTMGAMPVYGPGGYAGTVLYPQTSIVRTGEIAPNDALRFVAEGFVASVDGGGVQDLSRTAPLEVRSEMGMDWFARNNPSLSRYLASVEVKSANVALDDADANWKLGIVATTLGVLAPCTACLSSPCLLYPVFAKTRASASAAGTLRVFDREAGAVVHRVPLDVSVDLVADGFHNPEDVFGALSTEVGRRLGIRAAAALADALRPKAPQPTSPPLSSAPDPSLPPPRSSSSSSSSSSDSNPPPPLPHPTPSLERPAGQAPPPPEAPRR